MITNKIFQQIKKMENKLQWFDTNKKTHPQLAYANHIFYR